MQPLLPPRRLNLPISSALDGLEVNTLLRRHLHLSGTVLRRVKWLEDGILLTRAGDHPRRSPNGTASQRPPDPTGAHQRNAPPPRPPGRSL